MYKGKSSPWGKIQDVKELAAGIDCVSTAGHGGIKLDRQRNAKMPEYMRLAGGWYEEDCEWALPALVFPEVFNRAKEQSQAKSTLGNYFPKIYAEFFQVPIETLKGQSYAYDKECFEKEHENDWVVVSACGSAFSVFTDVPRNLVACVATKGGKRRMWNEPEREERYFYVPIPEYQERSQFGFVIDENKHYELEYAKQIDS